MNRAERVEACALLLIMVVAVLFRCGHLSGPLDEPHSWRQADTAHYARVMAQQPFPDVFHPEVTWLGRNGVYLLEFPLHEAVVSVLYKLFGEDLAIARAVTLLCFLGSLVYLFRIVSLLHSRRFAWHVAAMYVLLPLGVFYSRAIHVDFAAVLFAHATLYHGMVYVRSGAFKHLGFAVMACTLGFLIKAPYCFYLALPLLVYAKTRARLSWRVSAWRLCQVFTLPTICFLLWRIHCHEWNELQALIYPWARIEKGGDWFFGPLSDRFSSEHWGTIVYRLRHEVFTSFGVLAACIGVVALWRRQLDRWIVDIAWWAGLLVYVLVFFNLNRVHNYYQIPFLAPAAVAMACFSFVISQRVFAGRQKVFGPTAILAVFGFFMLQSWQAQANYYEVDRLRVKGGEAIAAHTLEDDLVVTSVLGSFTETDDPRILFNAKRRGWSTPLRAVSAEKLRTYISQGATFFAMLIRQDLVDTYEKPTWLAGAKGVQIAITGEAAEPLGTLYLYPLSTVR